MRKYVKPGKPGKPGKTKSRQAGKYTAFCAKIDKLVRNSSWGQECYIHNWLLFYA
jgi:hypothetical protein